MGRTALVLGAGIGGVVAAESLRRLLPQTDRVVAVDQATQHLFSASLPWLITGSRRASQITRPLERLTDHGVELLRGTVTGIDPARLRVEIDGTPVPADAIVVALGADYAMDAIPGLAQAGHSFYTLEGAAALRDALTEFDRGKIAIVTAAPQYKCPAAPYEAALLIDAYCRAKGVRDRTEIEFFAAEPGPMMVAGPQVTGAVRGMLEERSIRYHPQVQVKRVDPQARSASFSDGTEARFDLLAFVPPHRAPIVVREAGLTDETGWIPVNRHTLETKFANVYAIGDVTVIPLKMGRPLPKAGVFARREAEVVAHNVAQSWKGGSDFRRFSGDGACFIETGDGRAGMGSGNFFAEPVPQVALRQPSRLWHWGKIAYEQYWLFKWF